MFVSFAKYYPEMTGKSLLLVPSGIAHGPITTLKINCKHLPSEKAMAKICIRTIRFFESAE